MWIQAESAAFKQPQSNHTRNISISKRIPPWKTSTSYIDKNEKLIYDQNYAIYLFLTDADAKALNSDTL